MSPDGALSPLATVPNDDILEELTTVASGGGTWALAYGYADGKAPSGNYFYEASPAGAVTVHPFALPAADTPVQTSAAPVITSGDTLWFEESEPQSGILLRLYFG